MGIEEFLQSCPWITRVLSWKPASATEAERERLAARYKSDHDTFETSGDHAESIWRGPRFSLFTWVCLSSTVLCINIIFSIVPIAKNNTKSGEGVLYSGSCSRVNNLATGLHILINILSSLLLSASNYTMQFLCAPSRQELDRAHQNGDWLDIGVLSIRNHFRRIQARRTLLVVVLAISSLPLHLLYNSAVFKSTVAINYSAGIAQRDFASDYNAMINLTSIAHNKSSNGPTYSRQYYETHTLAIMLAPILQFFNSSETNESAVANLTTSECIANYGKQMINQRSDLLLISTCPSGFPASGPSGYIAFGATWDPGSGTEQYDWMCEPPPWKDASQYSVCAVGGLLRDTGDWTIQGCVIESCLSRLEKVDCTLKFSFYVLLAVILCNIVKLSVMAWTLFYHDTRSLVTIGDAIASYLNRYDPYTANNCLTTKIDVQHKQLNTTPTSFSAVSSKPWISAVSVRRQCITFGLCFVTIAFAIYLMCLGIAGSSQQKLTMPFGRGFGQLDIQELLGAGNWQFNFIVSVLIVNTPQLIISLLYVSYNGIWTTMLLASEFNSYYCHPKALRVTDPVRFQRSTYWLQLPYTYSVPLIVAMATLHWLTSESFFTAQIHVQDSPSLQASNQLFNALYGSSNPGNRTVSLIGYSILPMLLAIILGSCMVIAILTVGWLRKFPNPTPLASSCSLAIAAACHPSDGDKDAAYRPVNWGAIDPEDSNVGIGHCCFTSHTVYPPVPGKLYAGKPACQND